MTYLTHGPVVTSKSVFAINKSDHSLRWSYEAKGGAIINQSIVIGNGQIMFLESQNAATLHKTDAHFDLETLNKNGIHLVCLSTKNGGELWSESPDLSKLTHNSFSTCGQGLIIIGGSYTKKSTQAKQRTAMYDVLAFDLKSGRKLWTQTLDLGVHIGALHGVQNQRPILLEDKVLLEPFSLNLKDGSHEKFWSQGKRHGCGQISASSSNFFFRLSSLTMFNLEDKQQKKITQTTRPGCWINVIPAGGVVLVPESSSGCVCDYAIQTSLAFMRR